MTTQEFETIALAIKAAYPNSNILPDKYSLQLWYQTLADLEIKVVENAILEHISISNFHQVLQRLEKNVQKECTQ